MFKNVIIKISKMIRGEIPLSVLQRNGLKFGNNLYRAGGGMIDPSCPYLIEIGDNVTLARGVTLLAHDASLKQYLGVIKMGKIIIGNNVFVGANTTILCGVTIGNNCIIGAGSVVTHNIPDDSVYAGNPARFICSLDEYLEKHNKMLSKKPYYDYEYRFGPNGISNRKIISEDLNDSKYGYGEVFDAKDIGS